MQRNRRLHWWNIYKRGRGLWRESYGWWWISEEKSPEYQKAQKLKGEESLLGSMSSTMSCNNFLFSVYEVRCYWFSSIKRAGVWNGLLWGIPTQLLPHMLYFTGMNALDCGSLYSEKQFRLFYDLHVLESCVFCSEDTFLERNYPTWGNYRLFNSFDHVS